VVYNNECPNEPEDVLLVRFFLRRYGQVPGAGDTECLSVLKEKFKEVTFLG